MQLDRPGLAERFWAKVDRSGECWQWKAALTADGYGHFAVGGGRTALAHRVAYELLVGPIPEGLTLDHLCRNRACVRPAHLDPVTHAVNLGRGVRAQQTHCVNGHEFTPENTYWRRSSGRGCRACGRERTRRYQERKAARCRGSPTSEIACGTIPA